MIREWVELTMSQAEDHGPLCVRPKFVSGFGRFYDPIFDSDARSFIIFEGKQFPVMQTVEELKRLIYE